MTLREILGGLLTLRLAALVTGAIAVCVIAGPFQTLQIPAAQRAAYWSIAIIVATAMSTSTITYAFSGALALRIASGVPPLVRGLIASVLFALVYAAFLVGLGFVFFPDTAGLPRYLGFVGYTMPIAVGITIIVYLFQRDGGEDAAQGASSAAAPRILSRIKPGLGARLTRLTMQDHYVEVFTTKGSQLVLMRFADALEEVEPTPGWRIHRSHWVAEAAMADIRRSDGKTFVVLTDGAELPVSRTYLPDLKEAGVLKRFG